MSRIVIVILIYHRYKSIHSRDLNITMLTHVVFSDCCTFRPISGSSSGSNIKYVVCFRTPLMDVKLSLCL
jgi:hypothetical protein